MDVIVGKHAGFCFGVRRAVEQAYQCQASSTPCVTLGPLIHNPQEVERLNAAGIRAVSSPEEAKGVTLMIRSHGVAPEIYEETEKLGIPVIDATCPHVAAIHKLVETSTRDHTALIIVGGWDHPEVRGIAGWAHGEVFIFSEPEEVRCASLPDTALVVAQTTLRREHFEEVLEEIRKKVPNLTVRNTICAATSQRQEEAEMLSAEADVMIVVGGRNSSNTNKLYETCLRHCPRSYLVETAEDVPIREIHKEDRVALTAGASTPQWLLDEVAGRIRRLA